MASPAAPFISPFGTPIIAPSRAPVISPPRIPISHAHFAARPIAIVVEPRTHGKADPKAYYRLDIRRVWLDVDDLGIVLRHINHLRFCRDYANVALLFDDSLLRRIDQGARYSRPSAQRLNRVHNVRRLIQKDLSDLGRPLQVLVHPLDDVGIAGQGPNTLVPWLIIDLSWVAICGKKACRQDNIGRNRRCRQNYCDERVRIERNRTKQLIELFLRQILRRRFSGRRRRSLSLDLREGREARKKRRG
jgi:hypothetical protein